MVRSIAANALTDKALEKKMTLGAEGQISEYQNISRFFHGTTYLSFNYFYLYNYIYIN